MLNPLTGFRVAGELTQQQVLAQTLSRAATVVLRWPPEKSPAVRRTLLAARIVAVKMRLDPDTYTLDSLLRCLKVSPVAAKGPGPSTVAAAEMRKLQLQLHLNGTGAEASAAAEKWLTQMIEPLLVHVMLGGCGAVAEAPPLTVGITGSLNRVTDFRMIYGNLEKHVQMLEAVYSPVGELTVDAVYPLTQVPVASMVGGDLVVDRGSRTMALLVAIACLLEPVRTVGTPKSYREEMKAAAEAAGAGFPWALGPLFTRTLAGAAVAAHRMEQACVKPPEGVAVWDLMIKVGHPLLAVDVSERLVARLLAHSAVPEGIPQEESAEWRLWRVWSKLMEVREQQALGADEGRTEKETMCLLLGALGFGELITILQWAATPINKADLASAEFKMYFAEATQAQAAEAARAAAAAATAARPALVAEVEQAAAVASAAEGAASRMLALEATTLPQGKEAWMATQKCHGCHGFGHFARNCPRGGGAAARGGGRGRGHGGAGGGGGLRVEGAPPRCYECGKPDHFSRDCPQKRAAARERAAAEAEAAAAKERKDAAFGGGGSTAQDGQVVKLMFAPPAAAPAAVNPLHEALNKVLDAIEDANARSGLRTLVSFTASQC